MDSQSDNVKAAIGQAVLLNVGFLKDGHAGDQLLLMMDVWSPINFVMILVPLLSTSVMTNTDLAEMYG